MVNKQRSILTKVCVFTGVSIMALVFNLSVHAQVAKENLWPAALGKLGMVAAANPLASQAGQKILAKGGNAIDAIVCRSCFP